MLKYAKIINQETKEVSVGLGTDNSYYQSIGMTEQDVEQAYNGNWYLTGYTPSKPANVLIAEYEAQIEKLNAQLMRDMRIIWDSSSTQEEKTEAQTYFNTKNNKIKELIEKINELKN